MTSPRKLDVTRNVDPRESPRLVPAAASDHYDAMMTRIIMISDDYDSAAGVTGSHGPGVRVVPARARRSVTIIMIMCPP